MAGQLNTVRVLRVVVASPGDVRKERDCVPRVLEELNRGLAQEFGLLLRLVEWETDSYPGFHLDGPQGIVDQVLRIEDADIVIGIFWTRFGSPVRDAKSGTEHELLQARASWKKKQRPHIMIYFNTQNPPLKTADDVKQYGAVLKFKTRLKGEALLGEYRGSRQFESRLRQHLQGVLRDLNKASQPAESQGSAAATQTASSISEEPTNVSFHGSVSGRFSDDAKQVLEYLVLHYKPEDAVMQDALSQAVNLNDTELLDALHELEDAGVLEGKGNLAHHFAFSMLSVLAWALVDASTLGYDVEMDMVQVATAVNHHESADHATLLQETGLPEQRFDIAALLLGEFGVISLFRPIVRGQTFASARPTYKTRQFLRDREG